MNKATKLQPKQDEMKLTHTFINENEHSICKVRVFQPVLTPEEYERRHKIIEDAVARFARRVIEEKGSLYYDKTTDKSTEGDGVVGESKARNFLIN